MPPKATMHLREADARDRQKGASDLAIEQELAEVSLERGMFSRLLPLLAPVRASVAAVVAIELALVAFVFVRPVLVRELVDRGIAGDGALVKWLLAALVLSWMARFGLASASQFVAGRAAVRVLGDLRRRVFRHVQGLSVRYFDRTKAGRIVSRADRDVDTLEPLLVQGPPELLSALLRCVVAGVLLFAMSPRLLVAVALLVPVLVPAIVLFHRIASRNWAAVAECRSRFTAHLVESVAGVRVLQQTGREADNRARYRELLGDFNRTLVRGNTRTSWFLPLTGLLSAVGMAIVLVVSAGEIARGRMTVGQCAQALFYVHLFLGPLQDLGDLFERYAAGTAAAQRVFLLLDTKPEVVDPAAPVPVASLRESVRFDRITFTYDEKRRAPVLRDPSLDVRVGERVAIVGPTGHGKSTLVQLLTRFYDPQIGAVRIDGHDLRSVEQRSLRRIVSVVLQDNVLFGGTVLDNLRLAARGASDESILAAARDLGVDPLLRRLPRGYDTEVGPLGANLSHGQRQVVCLVRAYLADPALLVLDEATSAVDAQTERRIQRALRRLCEGRTAIVIAHRLSTIRDADRIAVIRDGSIVEIGTHDELVVRGGEYARIHSAYSEGERWAEVA